MEDTARGHTLLEVITMALRRGDESSISAILAKNEEIQAFVGMANVVVEELIARKGNPQSTVPPFTSKDDSLSDHLPYSDVSVSAFRSLLLNGISYQHARRTEDKSFRVSDVYKEMYDESMTKALSPTTSAPPPPPPHGHTAAPPPAPPQPNGQPAPPPPAPEFTGPPPAPTFAPATEGGQPEGTPTRKKWSVISPASDAGSSNHPLVSSADLWNAQPANIDRYDWKAATSFRRSAEGSAGVFFVLNPSGMVVVKGSSTLVAEVFAAELAALVGITVPKMRVLEYTRAEWGYLKDSLFRLAKERSENDHRKVSKELDRAFIVVMEYVNGCDLEHLGTEKAKAAFEEHDGLCLQQIGKLMALDIVCNNWDRLPLIWENDGNGKNVFFTLASRRWEIVGIDQGVTTLNKETFRAGYDKYINRVRNLMHQIAEHPEREAEETKRVRELFHMVTGVDIGEAGSVHIQNGILEGCKAFTKLTLEDLNKVKSEVAKKVRVDWEHVWEDGLKAIGVSFIHDIIELLREFSK